MNREKPSIDDDPDVKAIKDAILPRGSTEPGYTWDGFVRVAEFILMWVGAVAIFMILMRFFRS